MSNIIYRVERRPSMNIILSSFQAGVGRGVPHLLQLSNTLFLGWGKGGVEGLWSGDGDLHLDPDRPLPSRRRLSCQETDQPGGT